MPDIKKAAEAIEVLSCRATRNPFPQPLRAAQVEAVLREHLSSEPRMEALLALVLTVQQARDSLRAASPSHPTFKHIIQALDHLRSVSPSD